MPYKILVALSFGGDSVLLTMPFGSIAALQKPVRPHLAFASARLMALRWSVAGRALDFKEELCGVCLCIYMLLKPTAYPIYGWAGRGLPLPAILFSVGSTLRAPGVGCRTSW